MRPVLTNLSWFLLILACAHKLAGDIINPGEMINTVRTNVINDAPGTVAEMLFHRVMNGMDNAKKVMDSCAKAAVLALYSQPDSNSILPYDSILLHLTLVEPQLFYLTYDRSQSTGRTVHVRLSGFHLVKMVNDMRQDMDAVARQIRGALYYEVTYILIAQAVPVALRMGMSALVQLKAQYPDVEWKKPGEGKEWDECKEVTAYWLKYVLKFKGGSLQVLNKEYKAGYSTTAIFSTCFKATIKALFDEYKDFYRRVHDPHDLSAAEWQNLT